MTKKITPLTPFEIKKECEIAYDQIKKAEDRLKKLREICQHKNTFTGSYSYRVGASAPAIICSDCGELIKYKEY